MLYRTVRFLFLITLLVSACFSPAHSRLDAKTDAKKAIGQIYNQMDQEMSDRNLDELLTNFSPDFVDVSMSGKEGNLDTERRGFKHFLDQPWSEAKFVTRIQDIRFENPQGTLAVVTAKQTASILMVDQKSGNSGTMETVGVVRHLWEKQGKQWRIKRQRPVSFKATMNGKDLGSFP